MIAASGRSASFLRQEFPQLDIVPAVSYGISYPGRGAMALHMSRQLPAVMRAIRKEHQELDGLISQYHIGAVISDNRFGMWSERVPSVYITHQLAIKAPGIFSFAEGLLYRLHKSHIRHFHECWIPDIIYDGGLSGDLAHLRKSPIPSYFIGPQSRFSLPEKVYGHMEYDLMVIISGPEPQRGIFEAKVLEQLRDSHYRALVLLGKPGAQHESHDTGNTVVRAHMATPELQQAMLSSGLVICRPGYSSIMDLAILGKAAAFVPTPGQTEQEYLAAYHLKKHHYYSISQKEFNLAAVVKASRNYPGLLIPRQQEALEHRVGELLSRL